MKIPKFWLLVIVLVAILGLTNPSKEDHVDAFIKASTKETYDDIIDNQDTYGALGASIGAKLAKSFAQNLIEVDNYILFSIAKVEKDNQTKTISYGVLGNIFHSAEFKEAMEAKEAFYNELN